jgi:ribonuclease P protein component
MLSKSNRLSKDIHCYLKKGKKSYSKNLVISVTLSDLDEKRIGFVVSKRTGNSVKRNLFKRRCRAAVRELLPKILNGTNLVVLSNTRLGKWQEIPTYDEINKELIALLNSCHIIKS